MNSLPPDVTNGFLLSAIIQSDATVRLIQQELDRAGITLDAKSIRELLLSAVLRPEVQGGDGLSKATTTLADAHARIADEQTKRRNTGMLPSLPPRKTVDEDDAVDHDKRVSSGGG